MITSIELGDFLAHVNTNLEFENGVTVFVGDNGAGKSRINPRIFKDKFLN